MLRVFGLRNQAQIRCTIVVPESIVMIHDHAIFERSFECLVHEVVDLIFSFTFHFYDLCHAVDNFLRYNVGDMHSPVLQSSPGII